MPFCPVTVEQVESKYTPCKVSSRDVNNKHVHFTDTFTANTSLPRKSTRLAGGDRGEGDVGWGMGQEALFSRRHYFQGGTSFTILSTVDLFSSS